MQDVNKVVDNLNNEWASDMVNLKKRVAILLEENDRLKRENDKLGEEIGQLKNKEEKKNEKKETDK